MSTKQAQRSWVNFENVCFWSLKILIIWFVFIKLTFLLLKSINSMYIICFNLENRILIDTVSCRYKFYSWYNTFSKPHTCTYIRSITYAWSNFNTLSNAGYSSDSITKAKTFKPQTSRSRTSYLAQIIIIPYIINYFQIHVLSPGIKLKNK